MNAESEYLRAIQLIQLDRFDAAEKSLKRCLAAEPEHADALAHLAMLYLLKNNTHDAGELIKQSISFDPENYFAFFIYAKYYYKLEDIPQAIEMIDVCLSYYPEFVQAYIFKSVVLYNNGHFEEANKCTDVALEIDATDSEALSMKSKCMRALGKNFEAYQISTHGVEQNIDSDTAWLQKGLMQLDSHHYPEAKESLENAIRLNPESAYAKEQLLRCIKLINPALRNITEKTNQKLLLTKDSYWFAIIPQFWFGILLRALFLQLCDFISHTSDLIYYTKPYTRNLFSPERSNCTKFFLIVYGLILFLTIGAFVFEFQNLFLIIYALLFAAILVMSYSDDIENAYAKYITGIFALILTGSLLYYFFIGRPVLISVLLFLSHMIFTALFYLKIKVMGLNRTYIEKM